MLTQPAFDFYEAVAAATPARPRSRAVATKLTRAQYDLHLARALHLLHVSHPLYTILLTLAFRALHGDLSVSIAAIQAETGKGYHAILDHISDRPARAKSGKGSPHLFHIDRTGPLTTVALSHEGRDLLARVHRLVNRYAAQS